MDVGPVEESGLEGGLGPCDVCMLEAGSVKLKQARSPSKLTT